MDSLAEIVNLLSEKDENEFNVFLQKRNKRSDVKNIRLFNFLKTDDINRLKKIYQSKKNDDAYHALRKRLQESLLLFLSQKTFENSNSGAYEALRLLVVGRFLLEHNLAKIALKCLAKAEKIGVRLEQFSLLNEVLLLRLQFAYLDTSENLETLTERFLVNQDRMQREAKLNLGYAFLRQELQEINLKGKVVNLADLIGKTIRKYNIAVRDLMTYKSLYQILFIANEYAAIQQNYGLIESYIKKSHQFIQGQAETADYHLYYHLYILYYLANFSLRNKSFATSNRYLDQMMGLMQEHKRYLPEFHLRHQLLLALNNHFTGNAKQAIDLLRHGLASVNKKSKQEDVNDLQICLTMFLSQHNDNTCLGELAKLTHSDAWYERQLGMLWAIRKNLMEILLHAQFDNIELAVSRLKSFKRRYKKYLVTTNEQRVIDFILLIDRYLFRPTIILEKSYQNAVLAMLEIDENKDIFNLSFIAWLMARWQKKTPYQIALNLVGSTLSVES